MQQLPLGVRWRAEATFESFAVGFNGELVAALRAANRAPLWLWGGAGSGKTHLLQAVCAAAGETAARAAPEAPTSAAAAAGGGTLTDDTATTDTAAYFPLGGESALPPDALMGFESCRLLCLDDVDAVAGDLHGEQALFRLFNDAAEFGTRLIFAAHAAPRQLDWRLEDWRSRAAACVVYQVQGLDEAGRAEALRLRAAQLGLQLPQETSEYLLRRMPRDLNSLYDLLDQLDRASLSAQRRLTVPFIRDALESLARTRPSSRTS